MHSIGILLQTRSRGFQHPSLLKGLGTANDCVKCSEQSMPHDSVSHQSSDATNAKQSWRHLRLWSNKSASDDWFPDGSVQTTVAAFRVCFFSFSPPAGKHWVGVPGGRGQRAGRRLAATCGDRPFPAPVSEELMKLGLASVAAGLARKGQLKEGAGEGVLRRDSRAAQSSGRSCPGRRSQVPRDSVFWDRFGVLPHDPFPEGTAATQNT